MQCACRTYCILAMLLLSLRVVDPATTIADTREARHDASARLPLPYLR